MTTMTYQQIDEIKEYYENQTDAPHKEILISILKGITLGPIDLREKIDNKLKVEGYSE